MHLKLRLRRITLFLPWIYHLIALHESEGNAQSRVHAHALRPHMSYVSSFNSRLIARQLHGKLTMAKQLEGHCHTGHNGAWRGQGKHSDTHKHETAFTQPPYPTKNKDLAERSQGRSETYPGKSNKLWRAGRNKNRRMCKVGGMRRQSKGNPNQIEIYESTDVCLGQSEYESFLSCYCWSGCLLLAIFTIRPDRHLASIFHFVSSIIVRPGFAGVKEALCRSGKTQNSA